MSNINYKDLSDLRKQAKPLRPIRIAEGSWDVMCETVPESQLIATLESNGITLTKKAAPKKKEEAEAKPKEKKATAKAKVKAKPKPTSSKGKKQKR